MENMYPTGLFQNNKHDLTQLPTRKKSIIFLIKKILNLVDLVSIV